jgi:hypothetical protein
LCATLPDCASRRQRGSLQTQALGEASPGNGHPNVTIRLNNLAQLLQAGNRLGEAEPLRRRMVAIFLAFQRDTGHVHPHRDAAIRNYAGLLAAMGQGFEPCSMSSESRPQSPPP